MGAGDEALNNVSPSSKFTWRNTNFSQLKVASHYSDTFTIGSHKWKLMVFPKGAISLKEMYLSVYLVSVDLVDSQYVKFRLAVVDQINNNTTLRKYQEHNFSKERYYMGFPKFVRMNELTDTGKGYIVDDAIIVEVEFILNSTQDSGEELVLNVVGEESSQEEQSVEEIRMLTMKTSKCLGEYPNAGQLFEVGEYHQQEVVLNDEKFEDVGGFKILKTQASLYNKIWMKYGHIATSKVIQDSYSAQVTLVSGILTSLIEMNQCMSVDKMSPEVIRLFELKIKMAESIEFNVKWLREWFENVKKDFYMDQKLRDALVMQDQRLMAAVEQLTKAKDEFTKILSEAKDEFTKKLSSIESTISALLSESLMKKQNVSRGLMFDELFY